jgi:hypothetical protein
MHRIKAKLLIVQVGLVHQQFFIYEPIKQRGDYNEKAINYLSIDLDF